VINNDKAGYELNCEYSDCVGITFLAPFEGGYTYKLECAPGNTAMFLMKKDIMKMSYSKSFSEKISL
jgi:hypothetical protein